MPVLAPLTVVAAAPSLATALDNNFYTIGQLVGIASRTDTAAVTGVAAEFPGNLDDANVSATAGITNDQKANSGSLFQVTWNFPTTDTVGTSAATNRRALKLPIGCTLTHVGVSFQDTGGVAGKIVLSGNIIIQAWSGGGAYSTACNVSLAGLQPQQPFPGSGIAYKLQQPYSLNAGDILTMDNSAVTYSGGASGMNNLLVVLHFSTPHIS